MFTTKTIAAGLIAITTLSAVPANAASVAVEIGYNGSGWSHHNNGPAWDHQNRRYNRWHNARLSTDQVRWILRRDGYRAIRFFDGRGPVYQLRASKHGRQFYLVVSARSGEILSRHRI